MNGRCQHWSRMTCLPRTKPEGSLQSGATKSSTRRPMEIDQRVMNSLQLVSSLLKLQSRAQSDAEASSQLMVAADRILAIARVHQHMYLTEGVESVAVGPYVERLCSELSGVLQRCRGRCTGRFRRQNGAWTGHESYSIPRTAARRAISC